MVGTHSLHYRLVTIGRLSCRRLYSGGGIPGGSNALGQGLEGRRASRHLRCAGEGLAYRENGFRRWIRGKPAGADLHSELKVPNIGFEGSQERGCLIRRARESTAYLEPRRAAHHARSSRLELRTRVQPFAKQAKAEPQGSAGAPRLPAATPRSRAELVGQRHSEWSRVPHAAVAKARRGTRRAAG
eukprot:scaffold12828_cov112-Isochrysis_galbana.AAC.9